MVRLSPPQSAVWSAVRGRDNCSGKEGSRQKRIAERDRPGGVRSLERGAVAGVKPTASRERRPADVFHPPALIRRMALKTI